MTWPRRLLVSSAVTAGNFRGQKVSPAAQRGSRSPATPLDIGVVGAALQETQLKLLGLGFGVLTMERRNSWAVISGLPTIRTLDGEKRVSRH
jgi:hypothetical protein